MRIALVFPGITDVGFNSYGDGIDGSWHSHGLMMLSACLRSREFARSIHERPAGHQTELIDLRRLSGWDAYRARLAESRPDLVCITMMSCDFEPAVEAARQAKAVLPKTCCVVGGAHPSIWPDEVLAQGEFDAVLLKEGEIALARLAAALERGQRPAHRIDGEPAELDRLPFSDRELFGPYEVPISMPGFEPPFMTFIAGRGCRYNCSFCQPAERFIFGRKVRRRSPQNFVAELTACQRAYGFRSALLHDDCLIEDAEWVEEFAARMRSAGLRMPFACQGRSDIICREPKLLDALISVGLRGMIVGFESGSDRVLRYLRKGATRAMNVEAGKILHRKGLAIWANYMFGVPTETREEMQETIAMLKEIRPTHYSPAIYTPHPGSDLFEECRRQGLLLSLSHNSFRRNVTEVKVKGQDWHEIQWAVCESVNPDGPCTPYSKDYISHWGDLENLLVGPRTEMSFRFQDGRPLAPSATENLQAGPRRWQWRSTTTDPQFHFNFEPALEPAPWRHLFVDVELSASSRGQFIWWTEGFEKFQATQHFRIPAGRHVFAFDLNRLKTYQRQIGHGLTWTDHPISRLRFDPAESAEVEIGLHRVWLLKE
jgi:radical SAM superfamily enzyme YgiQ (UPF0313 family)